jgi:hypothetical protein
MDKAFMKQTLNCNIKIKQGNEISVYFIYTDIEQM